MAQPDSRYIIVVIPANGNPGKMELGFDSEEQAEHAAIELAEQHSAVTYRVYELKSQWKTVTRVERL